MPNPPVVINIHPPKLPSWLGCGPVLAACGALLLIITALSSFYTVPQDSIAVVLRFGKFNSIEDPGLRFKLPLGIDRATVLPVRRQMKWNSDSAPTAPPTRANSHPWSNNNSNAP